MLPIPPKKIRDVIDMKNGEYVLLDGATEGQREEFEAFVKAVETMQKGQYPNNAVLEQRHSDW